MKRYWLTIHTGHCVLQCSDGREKEFQIAGRNDPRIGVALSLCSAAGYDVEVEHR